MIRNHGQSERYVHPILGYNYRMTNLAAAIGLSQLRMISRFNEKRRENARFYDENLNAEAPFVPAGRRHVYHQYTIQMDDRDRFTKHLELEGVGYGVHYPILIHKQPLMREYNDQSFPRAEEASKRVVSIPVHPGLTDEERKQVVRAVNEYV